jgi:hypothetical protein
MTLNDKRAPCVDIIEEASVKLLKTVHFKLIRRRLVNFKIT